MAGVDQVSLVIATYNSAAMLERSLRENIKTGFGAIIIIDGGSTDDTRRCVEGLQRDVPGLISFYATPRRGLANARNVGTAKASTAFTMHAGPDNIMTRETVAQMLAELDRYDLVSCQTRRVEHRGYLGKAHDVYKKRYAPGPQTVAGTPYIAKTQLYRDFLFNEKMLNSDDTELGQRLLDAGKTIYRSAAICQEIGFDGFGDIVERWTRWGRGDALFYRSQQARWSFARKVRSWVHPFKAEIIDPFRFLTVVEFMYVLPFLVFVLGLRYFGWMRFVLLRK